MCCLTTEEERDHVIFAWWSLSPRIYAPSQYEWIYGIQRTCPMRQKKIWVNLWDTEDMSAFMLDHNMCEFMVYTGHVSIYAVSQYVWIHGIQRTCPMTQYHNMSECMVYFLIIFIFCITIWVNLWYTEDMSHDTISQYEWTYGIFFNHFYFLYHNVSEFMVYRGHALGDKHEILHTHKK